MVGCAGTPPRRGGRAPRRVAWCTLLAFAQVWAMCFQHLATVCARGAAQCCASGAAANVDSFTEPSARQSLADSAAIEPYAEPSSAERSSAESAAIEPYAQPSCA